MQEKCRKGEEIVYEEWRIERSRDSGMDHEDDSARFRLLGAGVRDRLSGLFRHCSVPASLYYP